MVEISLDITKHKRGLTGMTGFCDRHNDGFDIDCGNKRRMDTGKFLTRIQGVVVKKRKKVQSPGAVHSPKWLKMFKIGRTWTGDINLQ